MILEYHQTYILYEARRENSVERTMSYLENIIGSFPARKPVRVSPNIERRYDNIIRARRSTTYYIRTEEQDVQHYGRRLAYEQRTA